MLPFWRLSGIFACFKHLDSLIAGDGYLVPISEQTQKSGAVIANGSRPCGPVFTNLISKNQPSRPVRRGIVQMDPSTC